MGTTGIYMPRPAIRDVRTILERETGCKIVSVRFGVAWGLYSNDTVKNIIFCVKWSYQGGEFLYKEMDESMHPYFYDVPLKYIDLPHVGGNEKWRNDVREFHRRKKSRKDLIKVIIPGEKIMVHGNAITFIRKYKTTQFIGMTHDAQVFRYRINSIEV